MGMFIPPTPEEAALARSRQAEAQRSSAAALESETVTISRTAMTTTATCGPVSVSVAKTGRARWHDGPMYGPGAPFCASERCRSAAAIDRFFCRCMAQTAISASLAKKLVEAVNA